MTIDVIKPKIFQKEKEINAFVTLRNEDLFEDHRRIPGLNLGFNTQESPEIISQNRQALIDGFGLDKEWIAFANQVHSNRVSVVSGGGTWPETDGLITQVPGLALAIQIADCPAVLIADATSKTIAAVHAGWRGASSHIVPRTIAKIEQIGVKMSQCKAFISPCICVDHFEVGREVAEQFPTRFVDYENYEKPHVNLKVFLRYQLIQGGLKEDHIEIHPGCTVGDEQYYSYRGEGERSGRMMAVIQISDGWVGDKEYARE